MRMTHATKRVLQILVDAPRPQVYGGELNAATGLPSGTLYPILRRLEDEAWLTSEWEPVDETIARRRRRRYYRLTEKGRAAARDAVASEVPGLRMLNPGWAQISSSE